MDTKEEIIKYLLEEGEIDPFASNLNRNITNAVCEHVKISRTLASQYLNELHKHKKIIKVISRPVIYISMQKIEKMLDIHVRKYEFEDIDEYKDWYQNVSMSNGIIGANGSLLYAIVQIQTGLLYPNYGLPLLLCGHVGCGKKFLMQNLLLSNIRTDRLSDQWKLVILQASDFKNVDDLLQTIKRHFKDESYPLFYLCNLSFYTQKHAIKAIDYLMKLKDKKKRFNFVIEMDETELNPVQSIISDFIMIVAKIPDLKERPLFERRSIVLHLLEKETDGIDKKSMIESSAFTILEQLTMEINISALHRIIRQTSANAYQAGMGQQDILIRAANLPNEVSYKITEKNRLKKREHEYICIQTYDASAIDYSLHTLCEKVINSIKEHPIMDDIQLESFCETQFYQIRSYIDEQIDTYYYKAMNQTVSMQIIKDIILLFEDTLNIYMPAGFVYLMNQFSNLSYLQEEYEKISKLSKHDCLTLLLQQLEMKYPDAYTYANRFMKQLTIKGDIASSRILIAILTICIAFFNQGDQRKIGSIIISHGHSTATSIADTANFLLGSKLFTAMDMPMSMTVKDIAIKLNNYLAFNDFYDYVIILVDTGALQEITNHIEHRQNITYGILNNVSTALALEVGARIQQEQDFFAILRDSVKSVHNEYRIIQPEQKKKAILITSDLGRKIAQRISSLFKNSLPKEHPFIIIEYDFEQLMEKKEECLVFKEYDVQLLIRPETLCIDHVIGLSLEDLIDMGNLEELNIALNSYFTARQIEVFHMNLLKNFSLENVVEDLVILNARHLMDLVVDAVERLMQSLQKQIDAKTRIGIYIHICFLVERLVTKNEIHTDVEVTQIFLKSNESFVKHVMSSFANILKSYSVEIPVSEIKYLNDYIYGEEEVQEHE